MSKQITAEWLREKAEISFHYSEDDTPIRGNAMASGDDAADRAYENALIDRLDSGDLFAWFQAECRADFAGVSASDYLGCCSYDSASDFENGGDYADDMRTTALEALASKINAIRGATDTD